MPQPPDTQSSTAPEPGPTVPEPGPAAPTSPDAGAAPKPSETGAGKDPQITWLKEMITAFLGLAIAAVALWMLIGTYQTASERPEVTADDLEDRALYDAREKVRLEQKSGQKDVMLVAIGLFGSVIGYYFGRVPAERRADRAESAAAEAQATVGDAVTSATVAEQRASAEQQLRQAAEGKVEDARRATTSILRKLETAAQPREMARDLRAAGPAPEVSEASDELRSLLDRLR